MSDGVYPRVYGETVSRRIANRALMGLSPRVRGNHAAVNDALDHLGSIPACTGKPPTEPHRRTKGRVYPRVYGETLTIVNQGVPR